MAIEKAFSIRAAPATIWDALWSELREGERDSFSVEQSHWPNLLSLKVDLNGMQALITYRISGDGNESEVSATLEPLSRRYSIYQALTFGHFRTNYEMMLVEGLSNLKRALETTATEANNE